VNCVNENESTGKAAGSSSGEEIAANGSGSIGESNEGRLQDNIHDFSIERYKFILQQIHTINENVYRFLAIYQTLVTALIGGQLILFVNYKRWGISTAICRTGLIALLLLETMVACFAVLLIIIGVATWLDYRNEECDLTDKLIGIGFRERPNSRHLFRWYETYIVLFILVSIGLVWCLSLVWLLPHVP
jgi:hypothetical protein